MSGETTIDEAPTDADDAVTIVLEEGGVRYTLHLPHHKTDYIPQRIIEARRPYEASMLEDMATRMRPGDHIIDVGANIGNHTIYLAAVAGCRVTAFEPNTELANAIRKSAELNELQTDVDVVVAGVGAKAGRAVFEMAIPENLGAQSLVETTEDVDAVNIVALDALDGLDGIRLIKIDVEGMEMAVLEGAENLIKRTRPLLYIEAQTEDMFLSLQRRLADWGYCYWDTFNFTPTHLFIHNAELKNEDRIEQIQKHLTRNQYYSQATGQDLVARLNTAWEKYHQASEMAAKTKDELFVSETQRLSAENDAKAAREAEIRAVDALRLAEAVFAERQAKLESLSADLRSQSAERQAKLESLSATLRTQSEELNAARSEALRRRDWIGGDAPRWEVPLQKLFRKLKIKSERVANISTELAKGEFAADPFARLLLASIARTTDPQPFREKWYGFRLNEYGLQSDAAAVLRALDGKIDFSESERRVADALNKNVDAHNAPNPTVPSPRKPKRPKDMNVALLCDEFTYLSFKDEFNPIILNPSDWREKMETNDIDLLFCESAWSGVDSIKRPWKGKIYASENFKKENRGELIAILESCKKRGIKTVFWNKEDPAHYEDRVHDFVKTAQLFDYVFTTAEECVERYKSDYGCSNVFALPFAANPRLYNPVETAPRAHKATFAGGWYAYFEERCADMHVLFRSLADANLELDIFDRYYGDDDDNHLFPDEYKEVIRPNVPADQVPDVFKSSVFGVNINSVKDSSTMFARRAFELMASNTLVISNYSTGMEAMFGELVLFADRDPERLKELGDAEIDRLRDEALHLVLEHHTYAVRFRQILDQIQMPYVDDSEAITLVFTVRSEAESVAAIRRFECMRSVIKGARILLLVAASVPAIEVAKFYENFNRYGVSVIAESYLLKYGGSEKNVINTSLFALIQSDAQIEAGDLSKALLHRTYTSSDVMQITRGQSHKYIHAPRIEGAVLVGPAEAFLPTLEAVCKGVAQVVYSV